MGVVLPNAMGVVLTSLATSTCKGECIAIRFMTAQGDMATWVRPQVIKETAVNSVYIPLK